MIGGRTEGRIQEEDAAHHGEGRWRDVTKPVNFLLFSPRIGGIVLRFLMKKNETVGVLNQDVLHLAHCSTLLILYKIFI